MRFLLIPALALACAGQQPKPLEPDHLAQLLEIRRVYVDRLTGGDTAAQIRDMVIASLHGAKLFVITENQERADAVLRGSAEDLVFTDTLQTSDGVNVRAGASSTDGARTSTQRSSRSASVSMGDNESLRMTERKHEAAASVRLVNKDGDVIWSTTQESTGAKFRSASADVADKITRQLTLEYDRAKRLAVRPSP